MNITLNFHCLMTSLVAQPCPGEYKWVFVPAEAPVADFTGPAEEFLCLIIAHMLYIFFTNQQMLRL